MDEIEVIEQLKENEIKKYKADIKRWLELEENDDITTNEINQLNALGKLGNLIKFDKNEKGRRNVLSTYNMINTKLEEILKEQPYIQYTQLYQDYNKRINKIIIAWEIKGDDNKTRTTKIDDDINSIIKFYWEIDLKYNNLCSLYSAQNFSKYITLEDYIKGVDKEGHKMNDILEYFHLIMDKKINIQYPTDYDKIMDIVKLNKIDTNNPFEQTNIDTKKGILQAQVEKDEVKEKYYKVLAEKTGYIEMISKTRDPVTIGIILFGVGGFAFVAFVLLFNLVTFIFW